MVELPRRLRTEGKRWLIAPRLCGERKVGCGVIFCPDRDGRLLLPQRGVPRMHLVRPWRNVTDRERPVVPHDRVVRILHRDEERLHEIVLIALQLEDTVLLAENHRLLDDLALFGKR